MKRILAVFLALAMAISMTTVAFAEKAESGPFSGKAEFPDSYVYPGETVELDVDYFYGSWKDYDDVWNEKTEKWERKKVTIDNEMEPIGYLDKEYHKVSATWSSGSSYVENVYFEDGDSFVTIEIKGGISTTTDKDISGTIKIVEKGIPNKESVTYTCKIEKGSLTLKGVDEKSRMTEWGTKEYGLPSDFQQKQVRFSTEDGESYGTFIGEFYSEKGYGELAEFRVRIVDQGSLFLGFSEVENKTLAKKYPDAEMRFINWTARPKFDREGKLSIFMDSDEYIYGINDDSTLYRLSGTYDTDTDAYVITTRTLGNYVISDTQLSAGSATGSGTTTAASSASSSSSSSTAPSSTAPPPSSSTPAPVTSSTPAPPSPSSSSEEPSSSEPEESSEPEDDDDDESSSSSSRSQREEPDDDDDDDDEKKPEKKKGFPIVPVLLGVLGVAILVCAVVVVGNQNKGKRSRTRRRRYDDDWDD